MTTLNFDATNVPPQQALDPIPAGWYPVTITKSEMKPTSDGNGAFLALELTVMEGQYAQRKVFDRLNLQNANQVAQEIAYKTLSAICHSIGILQVGDSQQLHGIPLECKVSMKPAGPGADGKHYEASNDVKGYRAIGQGQPTPQAPQGYQPPATAAYQPPPPPQGAPAWQPPTAPAGVPPFAQPGNPAPQYAPTAASPISTPTASQNAPAGNPPQWQPPAAQPSPMPQWQPPAAVAPQQPVVLYFTCGHCLHMMSEYAKPAACPKCGCPNINEHKSMNDAKQAIDQSQPIAAPPAFTQPAPMTTGAPAPQAQPAGNPALPPWQRK